MHTITINFVTSFFACLLTNTLWKIAGFNTFDALLTVLNKTSKRTFLILGHTKYTAKNWGGVIGRQFLISD